MAPAYKLIYFDMEGLAESIRFLFSYGGIEFEDVRLKHEDWPKIKPNMPFGTVPVLEFKGKSVDQSFAIARYVGKQVKLAGNDDWENLEIDAIAGTLLDWRRKVQPYRMEKDEVKKAALKEQAMQDSAFYLERLDAMAGKGNGHLVLGRLTWIDVVFAASASRLETVEDYPNLVAVRDKVLAIPSIKKWIEKRPTPK